MLSQFSSVAQSCPTLCDPMDCSMPGLPVHHQLLEFTQTHIHWVGDAIQPSHPLSSPSPPASVFPSIRVFSNESVLPIRWPVYWSFSFSISAFNEYCQWQIGTCWDHCQQLNNNGICHLPLWRMNPEPCTVAAVDLQHSLRKFRVEKDTLCSRKSGGTGL